VPGGKAAPLHGMDRAHAGDMPVTALHLGRLFGVRIQLDPSVLIIFLLVMFNLGAGIFPQWHPDWGPVTTWLTAFFAAVLFLASILAHELSHALVARLYGIPVRSIRLFLLGGVADLEHEPESPRAEALMAAVGPAVSIGLGITFSIAAGVLMRLGSLPADSVAAVAAMGPLATLLAWLGPINIMVGVFNLLPGFPLDGGRVARALLWAVTGDLRAATRAASLLGQGLGWLFVIAGVAMVFGARLPILGTGLVGGLWLAFIGWFLNTAAATSYRQVVVRGLLEDVPIERLMRSGLPPSLPATTLVSHFVDEHLMRGDSELYIVADDAGQPVGVIHPQDVRKVPRQAWDTTPIGRVAAPLNLLPSLSPRDDAYDALQLLGRHGTDELLVADQGRLFGIVRRSDLARWMELFVKDTRDRRPDYGAWRGFRDQSAR
jgi:Zn-dependent protease